jgi:hypothetical protein
MNCTNQGGLTDVSNSVDMAAARIDRILFWPVGLAAIWFSLFIWSDAFGLGSQYLSPPFIFLYWLVSAGAGVMACIAWICQRAWRRLLSTVILPVSVLLAGFNLPLVWRAEKFVADFSAKHFIHQGAIQRQSKD